MFDFWAFARNAAITRDRPAGMFRWEQAGIYCLVILGIALRFRQYVFNRSLWLDEAGLALNVVDRDAAALLTEPLAYLQSAPPGFLVAARSVVVVLGPYEWALRIVPLSAGILVILLSVILARRELTTTIARLTFIGFIALSPVLIFYSSEFKQYSSDVLAAIAVFTAFSYRSSPRGVYPLAVTGFVALVCSLPAVFVVAPAGLYLVYEAVGSRRYKPLLIIGFAWLAGALLHGAHILQVGVHHEFMIAWWTEKGGFPPFPPNSPEDLLWYPEALLKFVDMAFKTSRVAGPSSQAALSGLTGFGLAIVFVAWFALAFIWRRPAGVVAAASILLTLIASNFQIYPFSSRLVLFLLPLAFFTIAAAIDVVDLRLGWRAATFCALPFFLVMGPISLEGFVKPKAPLSTDFRVALQIVSQNSIGGDALAIEPWSSVVFEYYKRFHAPELPTFVLAHGDAVGSMLQRVARESYHRVWYLAAPPVEPSAANLIEAVGDKAPIVFSWRSRGTRLVAFDFTAGQQDRAVKALSQ